MTVKNLVLFVVIWAFFCFIGMDLKDVIGGYMMVYGGIAWAISKGVADHFFAPSREVELVINKVTINSKNEQEG